MSDQKELLQAARFAWNTDWNASRAKSLASQIIDANPDSDTAKAAKELVLEIEKHGWDSDSESIPTSAPAASISRAPTIQKNADGVLTDVQIPFWRAVEIMVKWALAAIPAIIIVALILILIWAVVGSVVIAILN